LRVSVAAAVDESVADYSPASHKEESVKDLTCSSTSPASNELIIGGGLLEYIINIPIWGDIVPMAGKLAGFHGLSSQAQTANSNMSIAPLYPQGYFPNLQD
jgi:hypothetical protein